MFRLPLRPALREPLRELFVRQSSISRAVTVLFSSGQQGAWYDPSDLSTLSQDAAGATPVTAVEQPVGRMLDKSGRGNHATQATAASRPVLSARVNLLLNSQLSGGGSTPTGWNPDTATGTSTPNGTINGNTVYRFGCVAQRQIFSQAGPTLGTSGSVTAFARIGAIYSGSTTLNQVLFWLTPPLGSVVTYFVDGVAATLFDLVTQNSTIATTMTSGGTGGATTLRMGLGCSSAVTANLDASQPQTETGTTATRYQRTVTASDYDTAGFPMYGKSDGVDDSMSSATGGGGAAGFFFCQAIKPTGGAGAVRTLLSDSGTNSGYRVQLNATNQLSFSAGNGTAYTTAATATATVIGTTHLLTAWDDGTNLNVQLDSGTVATIARPVVTAGTAGFTLGKDNGAATGFFNGNLYPEVYRQGSGLTASERAQVQAYVRSRAGL